MWDSSALAGVEQEFGKGERILWSGQPQQGLLLRPTDTFLIPVSLFLAVGSIYQSVNVISYGLTMYSLPTILFVPVALYLSIGRFFLDALHRRNTNYTLTNQRVLIITRLFGRNVKSLDLRTLTEINLSLQGEKGTIIFGPPQVLLGYMQGWNWLLTRSVQSPLFERIVNPREVHDQIRQAQQDLDKG